MANVIMAAVGQHQATRALVKFQASTKIRVSTTKRMQLARVGLGITCDSAFGLSSARHRCQVQ